MALSGPIQALIAAFAFGILFSAASAGFTLYLKGHGSAFFRDGLRLALIIFLASSALWALVGFIATLLDPTASSTCQTVVIFETLFDQLGRTAIEQYLVWAVGASTPATTVSRVQQLLVGGRFIVGMVFVGESRPQFNSTCVPLSNLMAVSVAVIATDAVILTLLAVQALSSGPQKDANRDSDRRRAVLLTITALAIWQGTSVTLLLGSRTIDLLLRTTIPAAGLFVLIALVIVLSSTLGTVGEQRARIPDSPTPQNMARDLSAANDTRDFPPSRYEEVKRGNTTVIAAYPGADAAGNGDGLQTIPKAATGATGFGGAPVQGQLFPPMRPTGMGGESPMPPQRLADLKVQTARPKRPAGKFSISNPIPNDSPDMQNALNRIPTTDLATAAKADKEKRADMLRRNSSLTAPRPAPKLPQPSSEPVLRRITDITGKDGYPIRMLQKSATDPPLTGEGLSVEGNASTTSAQLSPASQESEVRRRSPRQTMPPPAKTPTFVPVTPGQPVRIPIPRPPPPPQPEAEPEPVKTPLQRLASTGLPSNPRARKTISGDSAGTKESAPSTERAPSTEPAESVEAAPPMEPAVPADAKGAEERDETVMFINNIVYDDPSFVNDIIQGISKTPGTAAEIPEVPEAPIDPRDSVLHRPRPYRRVSEDRQVFPGEITGHKRSRSGGSVLRSVPGSPTQLPPLPPPPKSAGAPVSRPTSRPHPNDTKSMTFDEKMSYLYNQASSAASTPANPQRKSSVPTLPPLPADYRDRRASEEQAQESDRRTTVTDRSSIRTRSILGEDDECGKDTNTSVPCEESRLDDSWFPSLNLDRDLEQRSIHSNKRKSSPVIPAMRYSQASDLSAHTRDEEFSTNWGSLHSPLAAVDLQKARCNAHSTYISRDPTNLNTIPVPPIPSALSSAVSGFGDEVVTVMLDTSSEESTTINRQSFYFEDDDKSLPEVPAVEVMAAISSSWHHQIGEEVPTFTSRKEKVRSRKMPPPAPLLLNGRGNKKAVMVPAPEPSPLESPDAALQVIQEQLRKFEQPNRDSAESTGRRLALLENIEKEMNNQEDTWHQMQNKIDRDSVESTGRRIALLEDLEQEMGQLDNRWKSIHQTLDRDSMSTLRTASPAVESRPTSMMERAMRSSVVMPTLAERRASRRARMSSVSSSPPREQSTERPASNNSAESNRSSTWQVRLAEAQDEYREHASDLLQARNNMNFLSVNQATDLGSPTPPETDGSDSEYEAVLQALRNTQDRPPVSANFLWVPAQPQPEAMANGLWMSPLPTEDKAAEPVLPALSIRPAVRKTQEPLKVESIRLWLKPVVLKVSSPNGLWSKTPKGRRNAKKTAADLTAKRPPRKTKRVTALPDILESPLPLPNKQNALGIFQFPWGEKSADATVQPRMPMFRAMPGTMTSGGPRLVAPVPIRPREAEEESGYSSSFFDDYEEEDSGDNIGEDYYDSGDDFDEATLDEIADLLKTGRSPQARDSCNSRDSLILPTMGGDALDDYEDEMSDYDMEDEPYTPALNIVTEDPVPEVASEARTLWVAHATAGPQQQFGLPQPDEAAWAKYMPAGSDAVRSKSREMEPASIESKNLWASASLAPAKPVPAVWTLESIKTAPKPSFGLPQPAVWSALLPAAASSPRPKPRAEEPAALESRALWAQPRAQKAAVASKMWAPSVPAKRPLSRRKTVRAKTVQAKAVQAKAVPTMWSPAAKTVKPQFGLPQPDSFVWMSYLPAEAGMVRAAPRKEEIAPIESTNLWMAKGQQAPKPLKTQAPKAQKQQVKATRMMWAPTAKIAKPEFGLPRPTSLVWASYQPAEAGMVRAAPRKEEIAPIESTDLWTAQRQQAPKPLKTQAPKAQKQQVKAARTMWTRAAKVTKPVFGLPQPIASVWASYMPADAGRVRAAPRKEEIAPIESTNLWMAKGQQAPKPLKTQAPKAQKLQVKAARTMWTPAAKMTKPAFGLPQPEASIWASYMPVDAGRVRAAPRKEEIAPIESTRLWAIKGERVVRPLKVQAKKTQVKAISKMWSPVVKSTKAHFGLPQPIASVWAAYLPTDAGRVRAAPRKEEIAPISSTQLWASKEQTIKPLKVQAKKMQAKAISKMWSPVVKSTKAHFGLPQPEASVWAAYLPADAGRVRAAPRKEEIAPISSTQLWASKEQTVKPLMAQAPKPLKVQAKKTQVKASSTMWSPIVKSTKAHFGLPQPASSVWASYLPADAGRVRAAPRKEEIAPISSTQLWAVEGQAPKAPKSIKKAAPAAPATMWTAAALNRASPNFGLPQSAAWESYVLYEVETARPQPRMAEMSSLESNSLWAPATPEPARKSGLMWASSKAAVAAFSKPAAVVPVVPVVAKAMPVKEAASMWQQPATRAVSEVSGLFDASVPRSDYRSTAQEPAALSMTRTPRPSQEPLQQLSSRNLWAVSRAAAAAANSNAGPGLWSSAAAPVAAPRAAALFTLDAKRKDYRTTSAEPISVNMARKPRQADAAELPTLKSSQLWRYSASGAVELDWITISTIRPKSPSVASVTSTTSSLESPNSDASSVTSTTTRASTVAPSVAPSVAESTRSGGFSLSGWFGKKKKASKAKAEPEVPAVPKIPDELRMPQVPEFPEELVIKCLDDAPPAKPAHVPLRQQWRAPVAFRGDWEGSLREAVAASYPNTRFGLVHGASAAQWDAALATAVKASRSTSPREWDAALREAVAASYPGTHFALVHGATEAQWDAALATAVKASRSTSPREWDAALREAVAASYPGTHFALIHGATEAQWDAALATAVEASRVRPRKMPRRSSSPRDWSRALTDAVAKSYPSHRLSRGQVLPSDWQAELQEAIARSRLTKRFDAATRHPVFAAASLVTPAARDLIHPAATGYAFDVAARHPVYFGSLAAAPGADVHPAFAVAVAPASRPVSVAVRRTASAGGRVAALAKRISQMPGADQAPAVPRAAAAVRQSVVVPAAPKPVVVAAAATAAVPSKQLWTPRSTQPAAAPSAQPAMWTPRAAAPASPATVGFPAMSEPSHPAPRKGAASEAAVVAADFGAQGMWRRQHRGMASPARVKDWLRPNAHKHASRIQLRY